jgi:hypothetical protein
MLMASIMLVAFASRALIPVGFMPATHRPFAIEICWDGLPADLLAHAQSSRSDSTDIGSTDMGSMDMGSMDMGSMGTDSIHPAAVPRPAAAPLQGPRHHHGNHASSDHCVFGSACSAGPVAHLPPPSDFSSADGLLAVGVASIAVAVRVVHLPPSRAPPVA